ncbi:MAG: hypothetical protein M3P34_04350 [Actinomycetota bacterium]|nr:hypothetical protein [Actinomycetota bacterium]
MAFISVARLTPEDTNGNADVYLRDRAAGVTRLVPAAGRGASGNASYEPSISGDGARVAYSRPDMAPHALAWDVSTNRVSPVGRRNGSANLPLEGLAITARGYLASTPEGALLGQERWGRHQVIRFP